MARPISDPDVDVIMTEQLLGAEPEPTPIPAWRPATGRYYFRTDPGHRAPRIRIPGVLGSYTQDVGREDGKEPTRAFYQRQYEKKYSEAQRATHEAVREANNGDWWITFHPIHNRFEAYLETDSDVLADYLRDLIATGEIKNVYEDSRVPAASKVQSMPAHRAVAAMRLRDVQAAQAG